MDTSGLILVTPRGPWASRLHTRLIQSSLSKCLDKNGNEVVLKNSPALELRFTGTVNKRTVFYFDRIFVNGNTVTGVQSRILSITKTIPLNTIKLIEIQDGGKKYSYVR